MNYYRRYPGDYARDTGHLSPLQHGFYALLLDWQYAKSRALPDQKSVQREIAKARTAKECAALQEVIDEFFPQSPAGRWNPRALKELEKARAAVEKMAEAGREGAKRRWGTPPKENRGPHISDDGVPIDPPTTTSSSKAREEEVPNGPAPPKAPPCPVDWIQETYNALAADIGLAQCRVITPERRKLIRSRWHEYPSREEWEEYWRRVRAQPFLWGKNGRGWKPNFDWLLKAGNFTKVLEMTYEQDERPVRQNREGGGTWLTS